MPTLYVVGTDNISLSQSQPFKCMIFQRSKGGFIYPPCVGGSGQIQNSVRYFLGCSWVLEPSTDLSLFQQTRDPKTRNFTWKFSHVHLGNLSFRPLGSREPLKHPETNERRKKTPPQKTFFFRFHPEKPPTNLSKSQKKYIEHVLFFFAGPKNSV